MIKLVDLLEGLDVGPTPKSQWVKKGDRVVSPAGWTGDVLKIIGNEGGRLPSVVVRWDKNRHTGRVTITNLRKVND